MALTHWVPARDIATLEIERLNRMFDSVFGGETLSKGGWSPAVDIFETADHDILIKAELPAVKREDIKVTFENHVLTIEGERTAAVETTDTYHRRERVYGTFSRSFTLPATADASKVDASYQDGVLTVRVPQRADAKPRQITING